MGKLERKFWFIMVNDIVRETILLEIVSEIVFGYIIHD